MSSVFANLKKKLIVKNRRFKQELAQKYGHAEVSADDEYSVASRRFLEVEAGLQSFANNVDTYCSVMQNLAATQECSQRTALENYRGVLQDLNSEYTIKVISILKETVSHPLREHLADMPQVKEVMEKRVRKKTDMDYYKQKLATLQDKGKADKVRETEDKLRQATEVYSQVTTSLMEWFSQVDLMAERLATSTSLELCRMQNRWYSRGSQLLQRVEPEITAIQDSEADEPVNWRDATLHAPYKAALGARGGPEDIHMTLSPLQSPADGQGSQTLGPAPSVMSSGGTSLYSNLNPLGSAFTPSFIISHSHPPLHLSGQQSFTALHSAARPSARYMSDLRPHDPSLLCSGVPRSFRYSMVSMLPTHLVPGVLPLTVEEVDDDVLSTATTSGRDYGSSQQNTPSAVGPRSFPHSAAPMAASASPVATGLHLPPAPLFSASSTPETATSPLGRSLAGALGLPPTSASSLGMSSPELDTPQQIPTPRFSAAPRRSLTQPLPGSPSHGAGLHSGMDSDHESTSSATPLSGIRTHTHTPLRAQPLPPASAQARAAPAAASPPPIRIRSTTAAPQEYVSVLYPFAATRPSELTLAAGAVVLVKRKHASGWWLGITPQGQGYFPSNYTQPCAPPDAPPPPAVLPATALAAFAPTTPTLGPTAPASGTPKRPTSLAIPPASSASSLSVNSVHSPSPSPLSPIAASHLAVPSARAVLLRHHTDNPPASSSLPGPASVTGSAPAPVPIAGMSLGVAAASLSSLHSQPPSPTQLSDRMSGPITMHSPVLSSCTSQGISIVPASAAPSQTDSFALPQSSAALSASTTRAAGMPPPPPSMPLPTIAAPLPPRAAPPPPSVPAHHPRAHSQTSGRGPPPLPSGGSAAAPPPPPPPKH